MTEALFHTDAYLREFEASVAAVDGATVALDRTAFFPGGGGQPHDLGTLSAGGAVWRVVKVRRDGAQLWHELEGAEPPPVGSRVTGALDWERRHALMRTHTALHVLCGVIYRDFGASVTGSNMTPLAARMDFELDSMSADFAERVEASANAEVAADRAVVVSFMERDAADRNPELIRTKINLLPPCIRKVRVLDIRGLDMQADGGTHVSSTAEVGRIKVVGHESKGRINKRLRIEVADA
ncbi:MAG: alanyl-tRNA editing protein [Chloroflexota bacterium]|nr:alanyl-tRNA editing protein [Chloroflexota bacterium]